MMRTIPLAVMPSEITLSVSPAHEEIDTGAAPNPPRPWHRLGARSTAVVFLAAAAHDPVGRFRRLYASLLALSALATIAVAARQLYIQSLPPGSVPACGASLDFMLKIFSLSEVLVKVLTGSGECARVTWRFLGLAMPGWVLIAALVLGGYGLWINLRRQAPVLRF